MVGRPTCHAFFGTRAACFICKPKRESQFHIPVRLEMHQVVSLTTDRLAPIVLKKSAH
jgi:hypothetical protein